MAFISAYAACETTFGIIPGFIFINTSDTLATVMGVGYLNGQTLNPSCDLGATPAFTTGQEAKVLTTDLGVVTLSVYEDGLSNMNLIAPQSIICNEIITSPPASASSSLALGTAYQNTLGYDVTLCVYLAVTAVSGNILLGIGSTNTPTQQTLVSGLSLATLSIIPVTIKLPKNYYAKLSTSGTITASISGQITMPA